MCMNIRSRDNIVFVVVSMLKLRITHNQMFLNSVQKRNKVRSLFSAHQESSLYTCVFLKYLTQTRPPYLTSHFRTVLGNGQQPGSKPYYGTPLGKLNTMFHEVTGDVYAVDEGTIFIKNFNYDGTGPDAYFWGGDSTRPDTGGFIIPDEKGS